MIPYKAPVFEEEAFNCPQCGAYADQDWLSILARDSVGGGRWVHTLKVAFCAHCKDFSLWHEGSMIVPSAGGAPLPNPDLPEDVKADYIEAREIVAKSPRGAAALLRLAIQKLCVALGEDGSNLNDDIASLVKKGLPEKIQRALDVVRVIGNNAVHPGVIDLTDKPATAQQLFHLVNLIAENQITQHKAINALYDGLPDESKEAIKKRDARK